jgi:hypothetical protein
MKPDLFLLARSNGPQLEARLSRTRTDLTDKGKILDQFCSAVREAARVTINMGSNKLTHLITTDAYPTPYDLAKEEAERAGRDREDVLREGQTSFYARRIRFDRHFQDGEHFLYGALNLRGVGPRYYGPYCVALKPLSHDELLALLPGNSLDLYVDEAGERVDEERLANDVAAWSHREHVAACKHAEAIRSTPPEQWPDMVCSPRKDEQRFIEAIVGDPVPCGRVEEIRIARQDAARLQQILLRGLGGETLTRDEQLDHAGQVSVLKVLEQSGLGSLYREV